MSSNKKNKEYYTARLNRDNLADVEKLHAAVYNKKPPANLFHDKYNTAYTGVGYVGYIAYNQNHAPVAYYGVIPCFIKHADQVVLAAQSADTMTHYLHRYKGLFVELANLTFKLCHEEGVRFVFGFPNQNSVYGFVHKLNWQITDTLHSFIVPVKALPLERASLKLPIFKGLYRAYAKAILKNYLTPHKGMLSSVFTDGYGGVHRDDNYLRYKQYTRTWVINTGQATVWLKINNGLIIGDMQVAEADFDGALDHLRDIAAKLGLKRVFFHTSPGSTLYSLLIKRYYPVPAFPVILLELEAGIPLDQIRFTFADIDIF